MNIIEKEKLMDEKTEAYIEHKVNEGIWELTHKLSHIFALLAGLAAFGVWHHWAAALIAWGGAKLLVFYGVEKEFDRKYHRYLNAD
jgi:hypothetical protein